MTDLKTAAAKAAGRSASPEVSPAEVAEANARWDKVEADAAAALAPLQPIELPAAPRDRDDVAVHIAWMRVMQDVQEIRKDSTANMGGQVRFRGVDATMNAFGAAQRRHGVIVMPTSVEKAYGETKTSNGKVMRECTVTVTYKIMGPKGDHMTVMSIGESLDTGDKATAKAMSVALRTLLLQVGMVPTEMPKDPDQQVYERGEASVRPSASYREEILDPETSRGRLRQIYNELKRFGQLNDIVKGVDGEDIGIGELITNTGQNRAE
jgi:hypothetical protein